MEFRVLHFARLSTNRPPEYKQIRGKWQNKPTEQPIR